jgi:hypothetical protein
MAPLLTYRHRPARLPQFSACHREQTIDHLLHPNLPGLGVLYFLRQRHNVRGDVPPNTPFDADNVAKTHAYHFMKGSGCGEWFDMRNLDQMLLHVHDVEKVRLNRDAGVKFNE